MMLLSASDRTMSQRLMHGLSRARMQASTSMIEGLEARQMIAQGKASLRATPWVSHPSNQQALKGRKNSGDTATRQNLVQVVRSPKFDQRDDLVPAKVLLD